MQLCAQRESSAILEQNLVRYRLAWPLIGFLAGFFVGVGAKPSEHFFDVAAHIIPVLVLALSIEQRFFALGQIRSAAEKRAAAGILALLMIGEFWALRPLFLGRASAGRADFVTGAIAAAFVAIVLLALTEPDSSSDREAKNERSSAGGD
jgi:hypothetical protein